MTKRSIPAVSLLVVFSMGCGICSALSDFPERYIEREVQMAELVGTWELTPASESRIDSFRKEHPSWGIQAPWRTILLYDDGTCQVKPENMWVPDEEQVPSYTLANGMLEGTWKLADVWGITTEGGHKDVPGVVLHFEYPENHTHASTLHIAEENNELILWTYVGDPDKVRYQDFTRTQD